MELKPLDLTLFFIVALTVITPVACVCENGWYEYYNTCFYISGERYRLTDVQKLCKTRNATLWTVHNETERQWVMKIIEQGPRILYWLDLQLVNRRWVWGDSSVTYNKNNVHWYQNKEGSTTSNNKCAGMLSYKPYVGQLQQKRCTDGWGTICTRPNNMLDFCDIANGWQYIDGFCLKFFGTPKTWRDARQTCQSHQGDLTMYKTYNELTNLYNIVPCRTKENIAWIGLSDTVQPRTWRWVNNDTVRYARWYPYGNRILTNGSTCSATDPINSWQWRNYDCDMQHPFICNRSLGVCPSGWLPFKDRCYQPNVVPASQKTWFDAKTYCEAMGTELLIIDSDAEQQFINQTLNTLQVTQAWLGFSDMQQSDVLTWLNGVQATDASLYQRWDKNFPKPNPKRFDCGLILRGSRDSRWSNGYCYNFNSFFCEMIVTLQPLSPTPSPVTSHCDTGWQLYRNKCYYFGPVPGQSLKPWGDALDYCKAALGNLVILDDPYEISYITVQQAKDKTSWIGLKYDPRARQLLWVDGSSPGQNTIKETNFYPGEPDDVDNGQLCIQIVGGRRDYTGSWDDGNCTVPKAFICEKDAYPGSSQLPTTPPVPNSWSVFCGSQWVYDSSENFCYQVVLNNPSTWAAARTDCQARGGDLLSITGRTEQNFVQAMLSTGQYASIQVNFWIGATDQSREGGWGWTDKSPFRYLNWHPGEPNNFRTGTVPEDCAEMVPAWNYQWNDKYCSKEQLYICKKTALVTSQPTITPPTGAAAMANCPGEAMISGNYSLVSTTAFTASSSRDTRHGPDASRWYTGSTGAWSAKTMDANQYLSVKFLMTVVVKGIITAGRTDTDEWVTNYSIQYMESFYSSWLDYMDPPGTVKIFSGNTDAKTPVTNMLLFPFEAKVIRLKPTQWQAGISLRMEVLGCIEESCMPDYAISGPLVVPDNAIQASSTYDISHDKNAARLKPVTPGVIPNCWKPITNDYNQWISADLGSVMIIRGVTIKGNPNSQQWVTKYRFKYSFKDVESSYLYYQEPYSIPKDIPGNTDNMSPSTYMFKSHFVGQYVKIIPKAWNSDIAIAFDVLVCPNSCESIPLVTGSVPISDDAFRASSMVDTRHNAFRARLNQPSGGGYAGAWRPLFNDKHQFIQVDLGYRVQVSGVATQGSFDSQDFVKTFQMSYSGDGKKWTNYFELSSTPRMFTANWDNKSVRKSFLLIPFIARYVRLWPQTWNNNIALRLEIYGCPGPDAGTKIGCYADNSHQRDLPFEPFTDSRVGMWPPMCIHHCFRKGYYYAGIQAQFKCFCGNSYGRYGPATDCTMSCVPKKNFFCGGPSSSVVYTTGLSPQFKVCPNNWKAYKDRCYLVLLDMKPWLRARADCQVLGGDLASPNSQQEQDFVYSLIQLSNGTNVWIGFNDQQDENVYKWSDGRQVLYTNWGLNQPSHTVNANQDCVLMMANSSGTWADAACDLSSRYVCQVDKRPSIEPSPTAQVQGCPSGWDAYRASCYLYADAPRSWGDAQTACQSFGSQLVSVFDRYEQAYLSSVLGSRSGEYWTDVTDTKVPGTFQYADLNFGLAYTNWAQNKPDATSQCVSLGSGSRAGLWINHNCSTPRGMVCKQPRIGFTMPAIPSVPSILTKCDNGTIQTDKYCYQVNVRPSHLQLSWQEALNDCMLKGGNLASFHSAADIDTVWRQGLVGIKGSFWIGLNDRDTESGYKWSDRSVGDVFNWDQGQPDNYNGAEDCIEMSPGTSKWNDNFCRLGRNWICMIKRGARFTPPPTVNAPTAGPSSKCGASGNWSFYGNACYYVSDGQGDSGRSWRQAREFCQQNGGDLASVLSNQEQLFMYLTLAKNTTAYWLWLGFNELDSTLGYRWSDGSPTLFTNWDVNEPNDFGGQEDCVVMLLRDGKWLDMQCSSKAGFVCKRNLGATKPTAVSPTQPWPGNCPTGFSALYNRCYKIFNKAANWTTALASCHSLGKGYSLASIRDGVENAFITAKLAEMRVSPWIGLKKDYRNQLQWINNDDVTYTNFAYGEPNGQGKEKCVQMQVAANRAGQWNDMPCSSKQGFICQTIKSTAIPTQEPVPSLCDRRQNQQQFTNNCYFFTKTPQTWNNSNSNCMKTGAYLASINSAFEQSFMYLLKSQNNAGPVWIGLNDRQTPGVYQWADKWPVQYTNWDKGQPLQGPIGGCVLFNSTGRWAVADCSVTLPSICKISRAVPSLTPPPPNGSCPLGWYSYINKCYYISGGQPRTVLDASLACRQLGAVLVSIHNQTVNQFLVRTLATMSPQSTGFWTSLHKSLNSGFQWIDGSPVQYTNWRPGEPSTRGWAGNDENCGEVFLSDGKWNDEDCNSKRAFICEKQQAVDTLRPEVSSVDPTTRLQLIPSTSPIMHQSFTSPPSSSAPTLSPWHSYTQITTSSRTYSTTSPTTIVSLSTRITSHMVGPNAQTTTTAVDNLGTGGVPTPLPRTPPISLPPQQVPTISGHASGQPPKWSLLTIPPSPGTQQSGASVLPTINILPYTGKTNQSAQQGGASVTTKVLGMSPGSLAGVIIGTLAVLLLAALVLIYWRRRTTQGQQTSFGLAQQNLGFENKTYAYNKEREEVTDNGAGAGSGSGSVPLRTMSESSS